MEKKTTRRDFLRRTTALGAAVVGLTVVGCGGDELRCTDTGGLSPQEQSTRSALGYVDHSTDPQKTCDSCSLFQSSGADACGGCTLIAGPIHPKGTCNSWAAIAS